MKLTIIDLGQRESDSNLRKAGNRNNPTIVISNTCKKTFELESELDGVLISLCELWVPPKIMLHDEQVGGGVWGRGQAVICDTCCHICKEACRS